MGKLPISKERTSKAKGGFTLVELSIVLVIIGLLIGGILAAQSMISTAKINAQVRQFGQFDAMVMSFKTKYNYLPGDAPAFGGDGDGIVDIGTAFSQNYVGEFACEMANFWNNIDPLQYPGGSACNGGGPGAKVITSGAGKNAPATKFGKNDSWVVALGLGVTGDQVADTTSLNKGNYYAILDGTQGQDSGPGWYVFYATTATNSSVTPAELLALDKKMDDGFADSGIILSGRIGNGSGSGWGVAEALPATGLCSSGASYTVTHSEYECTPIIRIGGSVGDPQ